MKRDMVRSAPFPYFGGKRKIVDLVWSRLGRPKQYIEPFCGSSAMLLGSPTRARLEVIGDCNGYVANFWRSVKYQPDRVAEHADYPVSHVDLGARHAWLRRFSASISVDLADPEWAGDPKVAGWWLWGQCAWIGSGWCSSSKAALGKIPQVSNSGQGVQALGKIPQVSDSGRGVQALGKIPQVSDSGLLTSGGRTASVWLRLLSERLERVRIIHGKWDRCLNHYYGGDNTAIFFDPPYKGYERLYGDDGAVPVAAEVERWALCNPNLRIAICGHAGDYDLPGWDCVAWSRSSTYGSTKTKDLERVWFSPACLPADNANSDKSDGSVNA